MRPRLVLLLATSVLALVACRGGVKGGTRWAVPQDGGPVASSRPPATQTWRAEYYQISDG